MKLPLITVGVVVEFFECIYCACLRETDGCGQGGSSEKFEQVVLFHHYFSLLEGVWRPVSMLQNNNASRLWAVYILQTVFPRANFLKLRDFSVRKDNRVSQFFNVCRVCKLWYLMVFDAERQIVKIIFLILFFLNAIMFVFRKRQTWDET